MLENLCIQVKLFEKEVLLSSDKPYKLIGDERIEKVFLPLSPKAYLLMFPQDQLNAEFRDKILFANQEEAERFNIITIKNAQRWLYSKTQFSGIEQILSIRNEKLKATI